MNKFKFFCSNHYGQSVEMKYRMFCIYSVLGSLTSFLGALLCCIISGFGSLVSYATIGGFLMMLVLSVIGHLMRKVDTILIIMSSFLNFIVFPIVFFSTGGLYSVAPMFFVMGVFIAVPILKRRNRNVLFILQVLFYSCVIGLCYFYPDISYVRPKNVHTTMLLFSFIIVALYTVFSTIMITNQYEKEQEKVRRLNAMLEKQAMLDPLTKLYNRRYLGDFLENKKQEPTTRFLIILSDIDDFKRVNDEYGHTIGDKVLMCFAEALNEVFPEDCFACRYGGEEFLIYCNTPDVKLAEHRMNSVKNHFLQICQERINVTITFSAGAAIYQGDGDIKTVFEKADALLYKAKRNGKNQFLYS